jgi:hypothetical protein
MSRSALACLVLLIGCGGDDDGGGGDPGGGSDAGREVDAGSSPDAGPAVFPGSWQLTLIARSNFEVNESGSYRIPPDHFLDLPTIQLTGDGQVAFGVPIAPDSRRHLWLGDAEGGELVYASPVDAFMTGVAMNGSGRVVFDLTETDTEGLYYYDPGARPESGVATTEPFGALSRGGVTINDDGQVGFRASFGDARAHYLLEPGSSSPAVRIAETALDAGSPYSFLFSPAMNQAGDIAGQGRRGPGQGDERPDEIVIRQADGEAVIVARDVDADPRSAYAEFDASAVAVNRAGQVAFIANLAAGGRAVVVGDGTSDRIIAREGEGEVGEIEFFSPDINAHGWVVFRGFDSEGLRAIWIGDGTSLERIATEHDQVTSDVGPARIDQETEENPVFAGGPTINDRGDVAFTCGLAPPDDDQEEWGTAVYVAFAQSPER